MEVYGTGVVRWRCVVQAVFPLDKIKGGGGGMTVSAAGCLAF